MSPARPPALSISGLPGLYRAFWRFADGQRRKVLASSALLVGSQLVKLAIPWLAAQAINAIQLSGTQGLGSAGGLILLILLAACLAWAMHGPGRIIERSVGIHVRGNLADRLYARVANLPLAWHETHHTGETQQRLEKATGALFSFAQSQFIYLQNCVNLAGPIAALTLLSLPTGGAALCGYLLIGLVIVRFDRALLRLAQAENDAHHRYSAALVDCLGNIATVISLRLQPATRTILRNRLAAVFAPLRRSLVLVEAKWCSVDLMTISLSWGLVALYAVQAQRGTDTLLLGNVFMVYQYAQQAGGVIVALASHYQNFTRMQVDYANAEPIWAAAERRPGPMPAPADWQRVQVDGLAFEYGGERGERPALEGVTLALRRGERVALVGGSGAGKTTLLRVLCGLYEPTGACYAFDGKLYPGVRDLRDICSLIPQEAQLFDGTLLDNLTFGVPYPRDLVGRAIRTAGLESVIESLPQGLDTPLSERGLNLSGGQKQRVALARGILAAEHSALLLLDEPTSALDPITEARFFSALHDALPGVTVLASVHRLHLLRRFDRVILMAGGRVIDTGGVDELLARQPLFGELWARSTETQAAAPGEQQAAREADALRAA
jgi:ABC-type multidrug transport system fused ATPase/permease subunit